MGQKNGGGKKRKNWFEQQVERFGSDFIHSIRADEAQKGAVKVFGDLARGNVNISTEGGYFLDPQFLENCIIAANSKQVFYKYLYEGLNASVRENPNTANDQSFQAVYRNISNSLSAFSYIYQALHGIKETGNLQYLYTLVSQLAPYKYVL